MGEAQTNAVPNPGSDEAAMRGCERFRPVRGFETLYEISDRGRVRSLRYFGHVHKVGYLTPRWSIPQKGRNNGRYASVRLIDKSRGMDESRKVHRMVADAFCGGRSEERNEVNHIDGNTENNHFSNLEWVTSSENHKHALKSGLASPPPNPTEMDSGKRYVWVHRDGRTEIATPRMMSRAHGLDAAYAFRMVRPDKYPHHWSHKGWSVSEIPNPGSDAAVALSCSCARIDNGHGKGYHGMPGVFVYTAGCPLHWPVGTTHGPFIAVEGQE